MRAVRPTRTKSTFCRQSSIRLHSTHTGSILSTTLWGKSQCEVAEESVIRRLQNTILWTGSEAECRDAVCLACSQRRCGESPHVKLQRVSSEDHRTPICGQAMKQSSEMRSALEFFATAQSCRERSLESVNRVADIGFSGFPGFLDFSSSEKFKTSPASSSSSELSAHQMAPSGVIAH